MINLTKENSTVSLEKAAAVRLRCSWSSKTDYDLYALVLYWDGHVETVATFPAKGVPAKSTTDDNAVRHLGDVIGGAQEVAEEIIEINLNPQIRAVVPVAYSAQSNGTGSFRRYMVSMEVTADDQTVRIDASNASSSSTIYTCVPGVIENGPDGTTVRYLEQYSRSGSENRPTVEVKEAGSGLFRKGTGEQVVVVMDSGPRNAFK